MPLFDSWLCLFYVDQISWCLKTNFGAEVLVCASLMCSLCMFSEGIYLYRRNSGLTELGVSE